MDDLLPCPFCGVVPTLTEFKEYGRAQIGCENEKCSIELHTIYEDGVGIVQATAAWNTRASSADPHAETMRPLLRKVIQAIDAWDGPMVHPFAKYVTPQLRAAVAWPSAPQRGRGK